MTPSISSNAAESGDPRAVEIGAAAIKKAVTPAR